MRAQAVPPRLTAASQQSIERGKYFISVYLSTVLSTDSWSRIIPIIIHNNIILYYITPYDISRRPLFAYTFYANCSNVSVMDLAVCDVISEIIIYCWPQPACDRNVNITKKMMTVLLFVIYYSMCNTYQH